MSRRSAPRILLAVAIVTMVVSIVGLIASLLLNAFVFDKYNAYGEVPIPGNANLELPAGEVTITFRTITVGNPSGGLPIPHLRMNLQGPDGADPVVTESFGVTTTVNNDVRRRVWVAQVPTAGTYQVQLDGDVGPFYRPTLAFGYDGSIGWLPWTFGALLAVSVLDLVISVVWLTRSGQPRIAAAGDFPNEEIQFDTQTAWDATAPTSYVPTDSGVRIEQLKTLAALRDSGALTESEFQAEKRRLLNGG